MSKLKRRNLLRQGSTAGIGLPKKQKFAAKFQKATGALRNLSYDLLDLAREQKVHPYILEGLGFDYTEAQRHLLKAQENFIKKRDETARKKLDKAKADIQHIENMMKKLK